MFQKAKAANKLEMVPMDRARHIHFAANKHGLGTEDLNACMAVVIASPTGAILGHFSPRPQGAPANAPAGDTHIQAKMDDIDALLKEHKHDFPTGGSAGVIAYAVYRGAIALPSQKEMIESRFQHWKIPLKGFDYTVLEANQPRPPGKGSVMVVHQDGKVCVIVEAKARVVVSQPSTISSTAESSTASSKKTA